MRSAFSDMPPPNRSITNKLLASRHASSLLRSGNTADKRRERDRQIMNALGQTYSSKIFEKALQQDKAGKYGLTAFSISRAIERLQPKAKEAAAARVAAKAKATLQKEAIMQAAKLQQGLGGQQQSAGYKKAKPKKK